MLNERETLAVSKVCIMSYSFDNAILQKAETGGSAFSQLKIE